MGLFGSKKPDRDEIIAQGLAEAEATATDQGAKEESFSSGNSKIDMEITKINAQLESFGELRKANSERFSRLSEQMGELRGMIMDTNKTMSKIEVSATKAIDLVESVQPEKLMIEIRKQEGKQEALKANIESNEALMKDIMEELKKMRQQMNFYKGIEQVAQLNDEVKQEILEIKKVEATIERHADKAESIFLDLEKKFAEFEKFERTVEDLDKTFHAIQNDFDKMKLDLGRKAEKKEFGSLMDKFSEFEKHTGNILKLLDERSKSIKTEMKQILKKVKEQLKKKHGIVIDETAITEEKLPEEEKKFLDKASKGEQGTGEKKKTESGTGVTGEEQQKSKISGGSYGTKEEAEPTATGANEKPEEKKAEEKPKEEPKEEKKEETVAAGAEPKGQEEVKKETEAATPSQEEKKPGLRDVLKKRRIITKKLSDEKEEPSIEEKKEEGKSKEETPAEEEKTEENRWE